MKKIILTILALSTAVAAVAQTNEMKVRVNKPGAEIQPTMYGIFIEDINFAADGGLYAELVKNRSFEFPNNRLQGWTVGGRLEVMDDGPFERNPHYVRLYYPGHPHKHTGMENNGFFGIGLKKGEQYRFSVWARIPDGKEAGKLGIELIDTASMGEEQAHTTAEITVDSKEWKKYEVIMTSAVTDPKATLRVFLNSPVTVDVEHVSLFPVDTWKGHENGLRKDLAQALYDLNPGLFRFPGGCIVEGTDLDTRYNWKNSVGPVENRPLNENRWQHTFKHRYYPDYFQSYGLGFYEYFLLSEEIGAEPLPVLSCGLACQFQNETQDAHVPVCDLDSYIQDALDLIEFANGPVDSEWGKLRAEMGHPEPFNLKFIGIGNEQWGPEYPEHLAPFIEAIRKAYPEIKIVGSSGPNSEGDQFDYLWPEMKKLGADLVDEHFYRPEKWFLAQGARYDNYDRKGPKVFAGDIDVLILQHNVSCLKGLTVRSRSNNGVRTKTRNRDRLREIVSVGRIRSKLSKHRDVLMGTTARRANHICKRCTLLHYSKESVGDASLSRGKAKGIGRNVRRHAVNGHYNLAETDNETALAWLRENKILSIATTPHTDKCYTDIDMTGPVAIIMGTEQTGLTDFWLNNADISAVIPMLGKIDSLNVATATTILLYEAARQRNFKKR